LEHSTIIHSFEQNSRMLPAFFLVGPRDELGGIIPEDSLPTNYFSSGTMGGLLQSLSAATETEKTVVFGHWTLFLDLVEGRLKQDGFKLCRVEGKMNAQPADAALESLQVDDETTIMLASLGVCPVSLKLTAANNVPPSPLRYVVGKCHCLGQKKEIRAFLLVMDKSIERSTCL